MNDKLQDAIVDLIKNGTDFVTGQIPDVVQQLLDWQRRSLVACIAIELCLTVIGAVLLRKVWRWAVEGGRPMDNEGRWILWVIILVLTIVLGVIFPLVDAFSLAKVITAPKVWLMEYAHRYLRHD